MGGTVTSGSCNHDFQSQVQPLTRESAFFIIKPKKGSRGQRCPSITESLEPRLGRESVQGALGTCDRLRPRSRCLYFWLISPSTIRIFSSFFWILKMRKRDYQRASQGMGTDPSKCQFSRRTKASCGPALSNSPGSGAPQDTF